MNILKPRKLLALLAALCLSAPVLAAGLDATDAGDYVWLHPQTEQPLSTQMRLFLQGPQWMMDGKQEPGDWQPVCRASGDCRLQASSEADVKGFKATLPAQWQAYPFACIQNVAMAFCRVRNQDRRAYWLFTLVGGQTTPIPLNRLR